KPRLSAWQQTHRAVDGQPNDAHVRDTEAGECISQGRQDAPPACGKNLRVPALSKQFAHVWQGCDEPDDLSRWASLLREVGAAAMSGHRRDSPMASGYSLDGTVRVDGQRVREVAALSP